MKTRLIQSIKLTLLASALAVGTMSAFADGPRAPGNPPVAIFSPKSEPYGESYGQWAADWWTWAVSIPNEVNPLNDTTGAFAGVGQHGPVWFLAGTTGNGALAATRNVTVPANKALFFPVINTLWTTGPSDPPITVPEITNLLAGVTADITNLTCTIDGVAVRHLRDYVFTSPVFSLTIPTDNVLGLSAAVYTPNVDQGFYLMFAPLNPGVHTLHFTGSSPDVGYSLDITYLLTVQKSIGNGCGR